MPPAPTRATARRAGFTLLELLIVAGLIALLTGLALGVGRRALETGKIARARSELAVLTTALECYRGTYGDYPRTADAARLLQSLLGRRDPANGARQGRAGIELAKFTTGGDRDPLADDSVMLVDPWGRPYVYAYKSPASGWMNAGFVLYSTGSDGADSPLLAGGSVDFSAPENADNIYATQH